MQTIKTSDKPEVDKLFGINSDVIKEHRKVYLTSGMLLGILTPKPLITAVRVIIGYKKRSKNKMVTGSGITQEGILQ